MAILLESSLFFRVNLLRCLRIRETLPGGLVTRSEVSQVWIRQLRRTRAMQEVWLPIREGRTQGIFFLVDALCSQRECAPQPVPRRNPCSYPKRIHPALSPSYRLSYRHLLSQYPKGILRPRKSLSAADRSCCGSSRLQHWREELSDRVVNYRKRRARLQPDVDPRGISNWTLRTPKSPRIFDTFSARLGAPEERIRASTWKSENPL